LKELKKAQRALRIE